MPSLAVAPESPRPKQRWMLVLTVVILITLIVLLLTLTPMQTSPADQATAKQEEKVELSPLPLSPPPQPETKIIFKPPVSQPVEEWQSAINHYLETGDELGEIDARKAAQSFSQAWPKEALLESEKFLIKLKLVERLSLNQEELKYWQRAAKVAMWMTPDQEDSARQIAEQVERLSVKLSETTAKEEVQPVEQVQASQAQTTAESPLEPTALPNEPAPDQSPDSKPVPAVTSPFLGLGISPRKIILDLQGENKTQWRVLRVLRIRHLGPLSQIELTTGDNSISWYGCPFIGQLSPGQTVFLKSLLNFP